MRVPLPELILTFLLALGFASLGELILRRRSSRLVDGNEAMLVGMGASAAALFPLTLVFPHGAVIAEAIILGACLAIAVGARLRRSGKPTAMATDAARDPVALLILGGVAVAAAGFAALNFRYQYLWDGFLIWATKAQFLSHVGGLTRVWFPNDLYDLRHLAYPPLVPLCEALVALLRGGFDFDKLKPVFLLFYLSLLAGTFGAARSCLSARLAAVATLLVGLVPALSTQFAAGAYADMPQAAVVAAVTGAALAGRNDSVPWLIGALTTVKAEGTILAVLACAGVGLYWSLESLRGLPRQAGRHGRGITIVAAFFALRFAYVRWISAPEFVYGGKLADAFARLPRTAWLCLIQLVDPNRWGLFWPAFWVSALALFIRGSNRERAVAATTAAGLIVAAAPFLFSTWPLELQIEQAYFRLAAQLAPAAAVVSVLAYARLRDGTTAKSPC